MLFQISKMSCGHCVSTIRTAVTTADPSADVQADLETKTIDVSSGLSPKEVMQVLDEAGYTATQVSSNDLT